MMDLSLCDGREPEDDAVGAAIAAEIEYDPAGLAARYAKDIDRFGSDHDYSDTKSDATNGAAVRGTPVTTAANTDEPTKARTDSMGTALEEFQRRNAKLLEALHDTRRQVNELGTLMEALEPVPGLDPDAFLTVLRNGVCEHRGKELDYRDVKIVQLAKRNRTLSAKLEEEKARHTRARRETDALGRELKACHRDLERSCSAEAKLIDETNKTTTRQRTRKADLMTVVGKSSGFSDNERLRQQAVLLRNKLHTAQEEVRRCHRVLMKEIGDPAELQRALHSDSGWKGRARQIVMLKARVKQLEGDPKTGERGRALHGSGPASRLAGTDVDSQAQEELHIMERQRGFAVEQLAEDFHGLQEEADRMRKQLVAKGARVTGLEKDNARLRDRVKMLLAKSDTDDRLVDALRSEMQTRRTSGAQR